MPIVNDFIIRCSLFCIMDYKEEEEDRSKHGGGVLIYVREDIPTKPLNKHNFTKNIEEY